MTDAMGSPGTSANHYTRAELREWTPMPGPVPRLFDPVEWRELTAERVAPGRGGQVEPLPASADGTYDTIDALMATFPLGTTVHVECGTHTGMRWRVKVTDRSLCTADCTALYGETLEGRHTEVCWDAQEARLDSPQ